VTECILVYSGPVPFDDQNEQLADPQELEEKPPLIPYQKDIIAESN
jgi:hypothetical protein